MPIHFIQPWWLLLLPLLAILFLPRFRRRGVLLTGAAAACLILSGAGPVLRLPRANPEVTTVVQNGADAEKIRAGHPDRRIIVPGASRLAEALLEAGGDKIYLYSNGRDSGGNLRRVAALLNANGVAVEAVETELSSPGKTPGVVPVRAELPPASGIGETLPLKLWIYAAADSRYTLELEGVRHALDLKEGLHSYILPYTVNRRGLNAVELNGLRAATYARPPYRVLLISRQAEPDARVLKSIFAGSAEIVTDPDADCELAVVSGGALGDLPEEARQRLLERLEQGMGLLFFTGRVPVGNTLLDKALPMRFESQDLKKNPVSSLVIIIDTSGSMSGPRIDLAREIARLALDRLRHCDYAGIVEFHGNRRWAAPLQSAGNYLELRRSLNRLNAGGGTIILPAIREAYYALRNIDTRLKHVLVITDGGVEYGDFEKLIREMAEHKITLSTVMAGPGSGSFLTQLSIWGGGRFYQASNRFALPELQFRQSGRNALPPYVNGNFAVALHALPGGGGAETAGQPPPVSGLLPGELKSTARLAIAADHYPLLGWWQYGMGKCAVFASELSGEWTREFFADDAMRGMWAGLCRSLSDPGRFAALECRNLSVNRDLELLFAGDYGKLPVTIYREGETVDRLTVSGSRLYRPNMPEGIYRIEAGGENFAVALSDSPVALPPDSETIARINRNIPETAAAARPEHIMLRTFLALLGMALFAAQVWHRRMPRTAAALLTLFVLLPADAGEYRPLMRAGIDLSLQSNHAGAAELYGRAADAAATRRDRRYARLWQFESARAAGNPDPLLVRWRQLPAMDEIRLELLVNELEERGNFTEAFEILSRYSGRTEYQEQLIRLAGKSGNPEAVLSIYDSHPDDISMIHGRARFELLSGRRNEAEKVYLNAVENTAKPDILLDLAAAAEKYAMRALAEKASKKAAELSGRPDFFLPAMLFREGKPDEALEQLMAIARSGRELPVVADYCERFSAFAQAAEIYRRIGSEDAAIRVAMLLEHTERKNEALSEWRNLLERTANEVRAEQAMRRILELAEPRELLEKESAKPMNPRQIKFIAMIYGKLKDMEGLKKFFAAQPSTPEIQALELDFLLENKLYEDAVALLHTLMRKNPAGRRDYLQQMTILAIETGNRRLADECLRQFDADMLSLEFTGAVMELLKDHAGAAAIYRKCLETYPDRIELWLSWGNAMKKAGRGDEAAAFFAGRMNAPLEADELGVMIDGLLNLEAPPPVLEQALEIVLKRLHGDIDNTFYYRLVDDLAEELDRGDIRRKYLLYLAVSAPERRSQILRSLMEETMKSDTRAGVSLGRILIGTGEILPDEIYRQMGKSMLQLRNYPAAERFFKLNSSSSAADYTATQQAMAAAWRDAGLPEEAGRMLKELLSLEADNIELRVDYGSLLELQRNPREAAEHYFHAFALLVSRQLAEEGRKSRIRSVSEFRRWHPALFRALVNCCAAADTGIPALLDRKTAEEDSPVRKKYWSDLRRAIAEARGDVEYPLPRRTAPARRPRQASAGYFAWQLKNAAPDARATMLSRETASRKPPSAPFAWELLAELEFEPDAALGGIFTENLTALDKLPYRPLAQALKPFALPLKLAIAEQLLEKLSSQPEPLVFAAAMRSRNGDHGGAFRLVRRLFEQVAEGQAYDRRGLLLCQSACMIFQYGDGGERRKEMRALLDELEDTRETVGDNVNLSALIARLYEFRGDYRAAAANYVRAWKNSSDDCFGIVRSAFDCYENLGALAEFHDVMKEIRPKQNVVRVFYYPRLAQLQRELFHLQDAADSAGQLNKFMQERELLRISLAAGDAGRLRRDLLRFSIDQRNSDGLRGIVINNMDSKDGMRKIPYRKSIYQMVAEQTPEVRDDYIYLLRGLSPDSHAFGALFAALKQCPPLKIDNPRSPQQLLLAALFPGGLTGDEEQRLAALVEKEVFNSATVLELLDCPGVRRPEVLAAALFRSKAGSGGLPFDAAAACLALFPPDEQRRNALELLQAAAPKPETGISPAELEQRLRFIRRFVPDRLAEELERLENHPPMKASWLDLALGQLPLERCLREQENTLLPWETILEFMPEERRRRFLQTVPEELEKAYSNNLLTESCLVRNLACLSTLDETFREPLLAAARRHHRELNEATLWLIDALPEGAEKDGLLRQMLDKRSLQAWRVLDYLKRHGSPPALAAGIIEWLPHPEIIAMALPGLPEEKRDYFLNLLKYYDRQDKK